MTTANLITILRILLVPVFIVEVLYYIRAGEEIHRILAIGAFVTAAVSDGVDGFIARRFHQRSELGALLDPLADKLLLVAGIVLFSLDTKGHFERLPLWLTATIITRDVFLLIGLIVINHVVGKISIRPYFIGKVATVLQMACVIWILFKWDARAVPFLTASAGICTGISGVLYILLGVRYLSSSPSSAPLPNDDGPRG